MPRLGLGMPIVSGASNAPVTIIDDVLWEDFGGSGGEIALNYQETRTNSVLHSQDVTDAEAWTKTNTAIDSTLYEAPDNSTTANAIKSNSTGSKNYSIKSASISVTAGKTYTMSAHVKKGSLTFAQMRFVEDNNQRATFNLNTGVVGASSGVIGTQVDAMDDDWYRCSVTFVATASSGKIRVFAQVANGDTSPNLAVSGVELLYVWGFQLEESIEATTYIVTTTEARTRTTTLNDTSDVWDFDSADLMPEADPDSEGVWEVPANVVTNGGFDTDANWTKGTGWTISGGKASNDGSFGEANSFLISSENDVSVGSAYEVTFTISNHVQGNVRVRVGQASGTFRTANGTYTEIQTATQTETVRFQGTSSFTGSIDNVTVTEYAITPLDV